MRCPVCGADNLSPLGQLQVHRTGAFTGPWHRVVFEGGRGRVFRPFADVEFARVCLDCGAVIPFVGEGERRRLQAEPELRSVRDPTNRHFDEEADAWID
jgi:hypothetical protein